MLEPWISLEYRSDDVVSSYGAGTGNTLIGITPSAEGVVEDLGSLTAVRQSRSS